MLKKNLIANFLGQGWSALMGIVFIPLYISYLGIESYGIIGLFAIIQTWLTLLDLGMTPTLGREMARYTAGQHTSNSILNLLRSIEILAAIIAILMASIIWLGADWISTQWLQAEEIPPKTVSQIFVIIGVVTSLRFFEGVYRSSIIGLQKQVLFNQVNSLLATARGAGAVVVLHFVSPTLQTFFYWQGLMSILTMMILARVTYSILRSNAGPGKFSFQALRKVSRFAGGTVAITFLTILLTQVDKVLLSRLLSLSEYGYYSLAAVAAASLYTFTGPVAQAWYPKLSELFGSSNEAALNKCYHQGAQLISIFMGSAAIVLIVFAELILRFWTQNDEIAKQSASLLSLLALGNLLNGLMYMPYQAQLAHGWTSLSFRINLISVILVVPLLFWITPKYGAVGAASVWVCLNASYVLFGVHFMYRKILKNEKSRWYINDIARPIISALVFATIASWVMPNNMSQALQIIWLVITSIFTIIVSIAATPDIRMAFYSQYKHLAYSR